jgi:hypothetical protein
MPRGVFELPVIEQWIESTITDDYGVDRGTTGGWIRNPDLMGIRFRFMTQVEDREATVLVVIEADESELQKLALWSVPGELPGWLDWPD